MTPITFINAGLADGISSLRIVGVRLVASPPPAQRGDVVVDLQGDRLYPGLINAHDHLQLNHLPDLRAPRPYRRISQWIADVDARRRHDPEFRALVAVALEERLLLGGVKNLLSGVTSVAHHDPLYPALTSDEFPVHVLRRYGWSHSLYIDGAPAVGQSYRDTPSGWPWMIHAAEGVDAEAACEIELLMELGCLKANTLLIHGIALTDTQHQELQRAGAALIWCPTSNVRLFGATARVQRLLALGRIALGSDSRMSGARDLLDELHTAKDCAGLGESALQALVTVNSARLLRLSGRGELRAGAAADVLILPRRLGLGDARRADVRLVLKQGLVKYGDADLAQQAGAESSCERVVVDGNPKVLDAHIARRLSQSSLREPGLELARPAWKAA
jgi:cytosine/adenosine deaminase-related metal-dependent hydrolase